MELFSETLNFKIQLTWLSAREDFIKFCCHESFKTYQVDSGWELYSPY